MCCAHVAEGKDHALVGWSLPVRLTVYGREHREVKSDRHTMKLTTLGVVLALVCCATAQTTRFPILNITIGEPLPELRLLSGDVELDMLPAHFMVR